MYCNNSINAKIRLLLLAMILHRTSSFTILSTFLRQVDSIELQVDLNLKEKLVVAVFGHDINLVERWEEITTTYVIHTTLFDYSTLIKLYSIIC